VSPTATFDRQCGPISDCLDGQYEGAPSTATSDKDCLDITACLNDYDLFEETAPTITTDRVCGDIGTCLIGITFEIQPPAPNRNRICGGVTNCMTGEYELAPPSSTANRRCTPVTPCLDNEFVTAMESRTSDRQCLSVTDCAATEYEDVAMTETTDRGCTEITACHPTEQFESGIPTATSNRICAPVTAACAVNVSLFESAAPTSTSDRECSQVTSCVSGQFQRFEPTETTDRVCAAITSTCIVDQFESAAPTNISDRGCTDLTVCSNSQYQSVAPTVTTDRICTRALDVCPSDSYMSEPAGTTTDAVCARCSLCNPQLEFIEIDCNATADRVCTEFTECPFVLTLPTPTSDRVCDDRDLGSSDSSADNASGAAMPMMVAIVAAIAMAFVLAGMVARYRSDKPKREDVDLQGLYDEDGMNPMFGAETFSDKPTSAIALLADDKHTPAALTQRGDRLWTEFRRCTSFDHQYFGNRPMKLSDEALEDVYALLSVTCPPRSFYGALRTVGTRFLEQTVSPTDLEEIVLDDVVDYILRAMPDVMLERGIDMAAVLNRSAEAGLEVDDDEINETFYAMIAEYVPEENHYLAPGDSGRRMASDAALREVHQVDPIYYEVEEDEETYEDATGYALANVHEEPLYDVGEGGDCPTYDMGQSGNGIYDMGQSGHDMYDGTDDTYGVLAVQAAAVGGAIYSNNEPDAGSPIYGMADAGTEEDIYGIANHEDGPGPTPTQGGGPIYGMASNSSPAQPIYGMASNSPGPTPTQGDGPIYGMASNSSPAQPIYGMASSAPVDDGSAGSEEGVLYDNTAGAGVGHEEGVMYDNRASLYDVLDGPADFDDVAVNPRRYEEFNMTSQAIYDNNADEGAPQDNNADEGAPQDKGWRQTQWQQAGPAIYDTTQVEPYDPAQPEATANMYEDDDGLPTRGRSVRRLDSAASVRRLDPAVTTAAAPDAVDELRNLSRRERPMSTIDDVYGFETDDDVTLSNSVRSRSGSYFQSVLSVDNEGFAHDSPEEMEADMMEMERDGVGEPQFEIDDGYLGIES
jgi:hypothetical protein